MDLHDAVGERLHRTNAWHMVRRRAKAAGITTARRGWRTPSIRYGWMSSIAIGGRHHSVRPITVYFENGGTLEEARQMRPCLHPRRGRIALPSVCLRAHQQVCTQGSAASETSVPAF